MNNKLLLGIVAVASIAAAVLGFILAINPKLTERAAIESQLVSVNGQNAQYEADLVALKAQFENIDELRADLDALRVNLPADADYGGLFDEINVTATNSLVVLLSVARTAPVGVGFAISPDIPAGSLVATPITISAQGDYDALQNFVYSLQMGHRLMFISSVDYTGILAAASPASVTVTGYAFTLWDPAVLAEVSTEPVPAPTPTETPATEETVTP